MIRVPESVSYEEVPRERRYRTATRALAARIGTLYRRAVEVFGSEAEVLIRSVNRSHGRDLAREMSGGCTRHDAESAALCLARLLDLVGMEGEVTELSSEVSRIRILECPYNMSQPEICVSRTALESEFVRTLAQDLSFEIEHCMACRDPFCQFRIEKTRASDPGCAERDPRK